MDKFYICTKKRTQFDNESICKIVTDEIELARHIKDNWACYIMNGLSKVESVETTVIEATHELS